MSKYIIVCGEQCQSRAGRAPAFDERGWIEFDPSSPDYERIEVSLGSLAFYRSQQSTYARRVVALLEAELGLTQQVRIEGILRDAGPSFAGDNASATAKDWIDEDFSANDVEEWIDIGVWDPVMAGVLRDAGCSAHEVQAGAESLLDGLDDDSRRRLYTDADPVHSVCNGDTDIDIILCAAIAARAASQEANP